MLCDVVIYKTAPQPGLARNQAYNGLSEISLSHFLDQRTTVEDALCTVVIDTFLLSYQEKPGSQKLKGLLKSFLGFTCLMLLKLKNKCAWNWNGLMLQLHFKDDYNTLILRAKGSKTSPSLLKIVLSTLDQVLRIIFSFIFRTLSESLRSEKVENHQSLGRGK